MNAEVKAYFDAASSSRGERLVILHELILECVPACTVDMKYKMPTYSAGAGWVAVANQKAYVSLYTCSASHLEAFKKAHPNYKTGKGCINFRDGDAIPRASVKAVIEHAFSHSKGH